MKIPVPEALVKFIKNNNKFIVAGHKEPDGDCVGSQLVMCNILRRLGKEAIPCSAGPFKRTEIKKYEKLFLAAPGEKEKSGSCAIIVDCTSPDRTGDLYRHIKDLPFAVIDHHTAEWDLETPVFVDSGSPSCTLMVLSVMEKLGLELTTEDAKLLFFGFCTDTGFFRHLESNSEAMSETVKLIRAGASPKEAYSEIHGGKTINSVLVLGKMLSRAESLFNGRLVITCETYEDRLEYGEESRDSDTLYSFLQAVSGVEAVAIIRQESAEHGSVGLRSRDKIDVARMAELFGGGGHKNAAGFSFNGTIPPIKEKIIEAFNNRIV
jgi:phosphoesterase RecJ-like protein